MNKEDKFLQELLRDMPQEKVSASITHLIMGKINRQKCEIGYAKPLLFWQTQAFYFMIAIVVVEGWFLYNFRQVFTISNLINVLRDMYVFIIHQIALSNVNVFFTGLLVVGVLLYLFVKEKVEHTKIPF